MQEIELVVLGIVGFAIGLVGGMVGLVLGVVRFPVIFGVETAATVAGTNIGVSTLGAVTAALKHFRENRFHFRIFLIMAVTGGVGSFFGTFFTKSVPEIVLLLLVLFIVIYESIGMFRNSKDHELVFVKLKQLKETVIGFGVGFLGGLVGLVLGSIRLPAMIQILKMEPKVAVGTNLAVSSVMGTTGIIGHWLNGEINFHILLVMGSGAMIGGIIGARWTGRFDARTLKKLIGFTLIGVSIFLIIRIVQLVN